MGSSERRTAPVLWSSPPSRTLSTHEMPLIASRRVGEWSSYCRWSSLPSARWSLSGWRHRDKCAEQLRQGHEFEQLVARSVEEVIDGRLKVAVTQREGALTGATSCSPASSFSAMTALQIVRRGRGARTDAFRFV